MQLFLITKSRNKSLSFTFGAISLCIMLFTGAIASLLIFHAGGNYMMDMTRGSFKILYDQTAPIWSKEIEGQQKTLNQLQESAENGLDALATKLSKLQARVMRLDALGSRLANFVEFSDIDFDISNTPGVGGREPADSLYSMQVDDFIAALEELNYKIQDRAEKLAAMESMLIDRTIQNQIPFGSPTNDGWISSTYGRRPDPISGKMQFHQGIDFAGKVGSQIEAVASGLVTWSGNRYGYGNMVEINHGNGFQTRYAHHKKNVVVVGQKVDKRQVIALMGESGRATGPHVHFEVIKNGTPINPIKYISSE